MILLHQFAFQEDTICFNVKQGNQKDVESLLGKIYPDLSEQDRLEIYQDKRSEYLMKESKGDTKDDLLAALTDKNKRGASFICIALSLFSNLSG